MSAAITDAELARLEACRSEKEWDAACDAVKDARGGVYPRDWWARVVTTGLAARVVARWEGSMDIQLVELLYVEHPGP